MKPLISVIMPVYNVDILLKKSIDSIINQTYKNLEIILVDDGSTDSSGVICDEYKKNDERIKVIHKENGGQALARNIALNVAKGDYYYFIDSDDEAKVNSIETLLDLALENNADIVIADVDVIDENGNLLNDGKGQYSIIDNKIFTAEEAAYAFADQNWGPWNKLYAKHVHKNVSFPSGKIHEDEAIMFDLFKNSSRILYTSKHLYSYLQRPGSTTKSEYSLKKYDWFEAWQRNVKVVKEFFPQALDKAVSKMVITAIYNLDNLLVLGNKDRIKKILEELKLQRFVIFNNKLIKKNYKLRVVLAITNLSLYKLVYKVG